MNYLSFEVLFACTAYQCIFFIFDLCNYKTIYCSLLGKKNEEVIFFKESEEKPIANHIIWLLKLMNSFASHAFKHYVICLILCYKVGYATMAFAPSLLQ